MLCSKCGKNNNDENVICIYCGNGLNRNDFDNQLVNTEANNQEIKIDSYSNIKAFLLCMGSLITGLIPLSLFVKVLILKKYSMVLGPLNYKLVMIGPFLAVLLLIYAKKKYPNNFFVKILVFFYILVCIAIVILFIYMAILVINGLKGLNNG